MQDDQVTLLSGLLLVLDSSSLFYALCSFFSNSPVSFAWFAKHLGSDSAARN